MILSRLSLVNKGKIDITIDARMINHSGIGTYLKNLIPNLVNFYKVSLIGNKNILSSFSWSTNSNIIDADYPIYSIAEQLKLPKDIPESKIFISPHYNIPIRKILADTRIVVIHDVNHLLGFNKISLIKKLYAKFMLSSAVKLSDKVITDSEFSKKEINDHISTGDKEINVVYCGIDYVQINNMANKFNVELIKNKYHLPVKYFLYAGSIKKHKNLITVLKAFKSFSQTHPGISLALIGLKYSEFKSELEFEGLRENVFVTGFITDKDLPGIYANAVCLIFPSYYEGFGLPPLEAMSSGCPVISSNASSLPEVCGDATLQFDPTNVANLVEQMNIIVNNNDETNNLRQKGFENVKRFSSDNFGKNFRTQIDELLSKF